MPEHRIQARLTHQGFFADIIYNDRVDPPIYHWVVQREGDPEVLAWGTDRTREGADAAARRTMEWHVVQRREMA